MRRRRPLVIAIAMMLVPSVLAVADAVAYLSANRSTHVLISQGVEREYTLYVPSSLNGNTPAPLVISLHGAGMWPAAQQALSQWDRVAEREGFIVAYPSGRSGRGPRVTGPPDVPFIADMIETIARSYSIDPARVFANGLSNGGGTSFVLSCTMPDRIAAVGLVASALLQPWEWCPDRRPVPMIAFHGTADDWTPYHGGSSIVAPRPFPSIPKWTQNWARRNRCVLSPVETRVAHDVTRLEYAECESHAPAILYTIQGGGHTWPGGGYIPQWFVGVNTHSIDASSIMWEFFSRHPLTAN
jgi:polyhydroxybutyrate depolymerase